MMKLPAILTNPRYLLPLIISVSFLIALSCIDDIWDGVSSGRLFAPSAMAQTKAEGAKTDTAKASAPPTITPPTVAPPASADAAPPAADNAAATDDTDVSPAEMEVLKQLSTRRGELDKRAKDLDTREALMKVAETRVDQKIKELETLRQQLQVMVNQAGEAQNVQIENLVKIYETMKPDEAARIFETLDMPVLLGVIQKMKPARTAPIMAKMAPEKAKELTVALTKQDRLPQIK